MEKHGVKIYSLGDNSFTHSPGTVWPLGYKKVVSGNFRIAEPYIPSLTKAPNAQPSDRTAARRIITVSARDKAGRGTP